jgi:hypothetical protein
MDGWELIIRGCNGMTDFKRYDIEVRFKPDTREGKTVIISTVT